MLTVRLARAGNKKRPFYHIVVTDSENPRDGRFLERLGAYDPKLPASAISLNEARLQHWESVGAKASERVTKMLRERQRAGGAVAPKVD